MKQTANHDLIAFASGILGAIGAALLLIPSELKIIPGIKLNVLFGILGLLSFLLALSLQILSVMSLSNKRSALIRSSAVVLLFTYTWVYWKAGYYLEGIVLCISGILFFASITPLQKYLHHLNITNLIFVLVGFTNGIVLAVSNTQYAQYDLVNYKTFLVISFLVTALAGGIAAVIPSTRYNSILMRLHILPWLVWCFIFIQVAPMATLLIPFLAMIAILLNGIMPWSLLSLTKEDVLGRRSIMIAASLEVTLLLFLWALLTTLDNSFNEKISSLGTVRITTFLFFSLVSLVVYYEIFSILMTINGLIHELKKPKKKRKRKFFIHSIIGIGENAYPYISSHSFSLRNWCVLASMHKQIKLKSSRINWQMKRNVILKSPCFWS